MCYRKKRVWCEQLQLRASRAYGADPPLVLPQRDTWVTRIFIDVAKLY